LDGLTNNTNCQRARLVALAPRNGADAPLAMIGSGHPVLAKHINCCEGGEFSRPFIFPGVWGEAPFKDRVRLARRLERRLECPRIASPRRRRGRDHRKRAPAARRIMFETGPFSIWRCYAVKTKASSAIRRRPRLEPAPLSAVSFERPRGAAQKSGARPMRQEAPATMRLQPTAKSSIKHRYSPQTRRVSFYPLGKSVP